MSSIISVGTAVPPHIYAPGKTACRMAGAHFNGSIENVDKYLQVFKTSLVSERHFCASSP